MYGIGIRLVRRYENDEEGSGKFIYREKKSTKHTYLIFINNKYNLHY